MKAILYTLLYVMFLSGVFAGCIAHKRNTACAEKQLFNDALQAIDTDSLLVWRMHQSSTRMEMRLQHIAFSKPDSLGQQYIQHMTLLDGKQEEKDTATLQMQQVDNRQTEYIRHRSVDKQELHQAENKPIGISMAHLLFLALVSIVLLTVGLPVVKRLGLKILSK